MRRRSTIAVALLGILRAVLIPNGAATPAAPAASAVPLTLTQVQARVNAIRRHAPAEHVQPTRNTRRIQGTLAGTTYASTNWAGYVDLYHGYNRVVSQWRVPSVTCLGESYVAFWVGLDGWNNGSVEQDGTGAYCSAYGAVPSYFAWWEMYPENDMQLTYSVRPGDVVAAGVQYLGGNRYWLQVHDISRGVTNNQYPSYTLGGYAPRDSAEWVAEAPSDGYTGLRYDLAKFANTEFAGDLAREGSTSHYARTWPHAGIVMQQSSVDAVPSGFNTAGTAFTAYWKNSS